MGILHNSGAALVVAGALVAPGLWLTATSPAHSIPAPQVHTVRACPAEDSPGPCFWDAGRRGNHRGHSFFRDGSGQVHYLPTPRRAFRYFRGWHPVPPELADALREGPGARRNWTHCAVHTGSTTYVVCPDGHEETS